MVLKFIAGLKHYHGLMFNALVNPLAFSLLDYFNIIKQPMGMGTIDCLNVGQWVGVSINDPKGEASHFEQGGWLIWVHMA